jgi:hypothetical protein
LPVRSVGAVPASYLDDPRCKTIAELPGVESLVLLPDLHIKQKYVELGYQCVVPSSSVTASSLDALYPQIRSKGIGCGMALWPLGIARDPDARGSASELKLETMFKGIFATLLRRPSPLASADEILGRKRPSLPNLVGRGRYGMIRRDWWSATLEGARGYLEKHGCADDALVAAFEKSGNHIGDAERTLQVDVEPRFSEGMRDRQDFAGGDRMAGLWVRGNHYIEAQQVTEIYDERAAERASLDLYALAIMNHSCGFNLEGVLDSDFGERRIFLSGFRPIAASEQDYDAVRFAAAVLKNLGSVRRATFYRRARDSAARHFPEAEVRLLAECNHNDIEWSAERIVYRHNALRLNPGRFQIISGLYNHPSYLIEPGPRSEVSYHSAPHGLGAWLVEQEYVPDPERSVVRLGIEHQPGRSRYYLQPKEVRKSIPYFKGDPGDRLLGSLEEEGVIKRIAKLSPILSVNHDW